VAGLGLGNHANVMLRLGRVDEARASAAEAIEHYQASNWRAAGAALMCLGEADLERGDVARARAGYLRAVELSDQIEDTHTAASARASLALALALDDPEAAAEQARRAVEHSVGWNRAPAHFAWAFAAAAAGDAEVARAALAEVEVAAAENSDARSLALGLELSAVLAVPADQTALAAAADQWQISGDAIGALRHQLLRARSAADVDAEQRAVIALRDQGLAVEVGVVTLLPRLQPSASSEVAVDQRPEVRTLGRFQVVRAGVVVAPREWQSRKARDLVKLLIARQGQPVTRDQAAEVLWPEDNSDGIANRLSVLLTTIRRVFDPEREHPQDHYLSADDNALALRVDRLDIDVLRFLEEVEQARGLVEAGASEPAQLLAAQARYNGDFLEEDVYADWSVDLREQARDALLWTYRQLAATASANEDHEGALAQLRRLLERDAYDERAWLDLVRALRALRRPGEARRQHARYCHFMDELDAPAVPYAELATP
jgi:DNA-binding SARP family transcriptional activator